MTENVLPGKYLLTTNELQRFKKVLAAVNIDNRDELTNLSLNTAGIYFWVLNPKNKQEIESHRTMLLDENETKSEKQDGR